MSLISSVNTQNITSNPFDVIHVNNTTYNLTNMHNFCLRSEDKDKFIRIIYNPTFTNFGYSDPQGRTVFVCALIRGWCDCVDYIMSHDNIHTHINALCQLKKNTMMYAIMGRLPKIASKIMNDSQFNQLNTVDIYGRTVLHFAIESRMPNLALEIASNPKFTNFCSKNSIMYDFTSLICAINFKMYDVVKAILSRIDVDNGLNILTKDNHSALTYAISDCDDEISLMIMSRDDFKHWNTISKFGNSVLNNAIFHGRHSIAQAIVSNKKFKCFNTIESISGLTTQAYAQKLGWSDVVDIIVERTS